MILLRLLLAFALMGFAGLGIVAWLHPRRALCWSEIAGQSVFFGSAAISLLLAALSPWCGGALLVGGVGAIAVASGGLGLRRVGLGREPLPRGLAIAVAVATLLVCWQALAQPLAGDGLFNFEIRAQLGWQQGGRMPFSFFGDPSRAWMHSSYPLFISFDQLWLYLCMGERSHRVDLAEPCKWMVACQFTQRR